VIELKKSEMYKIIPLCEGNEQDEVWSCIQGYMGRAFVDDIDNPRCAKLLVADFCFLFGYPSNDQVARDIVIHMEEDCKHKIIDVKNEKWGQLIEEIYDTRHRKFSRYSMKANKEDFNVNKLTAYAESIPEGYVMKEIDEELYHKVFKKDWTLDYCSNFSSFKDFQLNGIGYLILLKDEIISGASSYSCTKGSISITIGTEQEHRRKGLALASASKLILECLQKNLYPSWEAANTNSIALAEKLGYTLVGEYFVYAIK
jgi:hypothetical protein